MAALDVPRSTDEVCTLVFATLDVPVSDGKVYFLLRPTIGAYLAHLDRIGKVEIENRDPGAYGDAGEPRSMSSMMRLAMSFPRRTL